MSDYDSGEEGSEAGSEQSRNSDYPDIVSEVDPEEIENRYNDLIIEKYRLILAFNSGSVDTQVYMFNIQRINRELNETQYNARETEQRIIEKEIELRNMVDALESKIEEKSLKQQSLTPEEIEAVKRTRYELEDLYEAHKHLEEDYDPLDSNSLYIEWNAMSMDEKRNLEQLTKQKYPEIKDFANAPRGAFEKAQGQFIDNVSIFLDNYWVPYEEKEEVELLSLAKSMEIAPPKKGTYGYMLFLNYMRTLLPKGYVYKTGTTRPGAVYKKVEIPSLKQMTDEIKINQYLRPVYLETDELEFSQKLKIYNRLLGKLTKEELVTCISNTHNIKNPVNRDKKGNLIIRKKEDTPKLFFARNLSKHKMVYSLKKINLPDLVVLVLDTGERVDNVIYKVNLLENYIFKLTKNSPKDYYKKINQILFIFENYPGFKEKFLGGAINIYQLALFENILIESGKTLVFPVNPGIRKSSLQKLFQEIYVNSYFRSQILAKILINRKSKELERFVLDLAENKRDYIVKIQKLLAYIRKNETNGIFNIKFDNLLQIFKERDSPVVEQADYSKMNASEIKALLLQEQYKLGEIEKKIKILESKNYSSVYAYFWKLPDIVSKERKQEWNSVIKKIEDKLSQRPVTIKDTKLVEVYMKELNILKSYIIKYYKLDTVPGLGDLARDMIKTNENIKTLTGLYVNLIHSESRQSRALNPRQEPLQPFESTNIYPTINEQVITEFVNSIKRTLIQTPINLLELYDINELNNKSTVRYNGKDIRVMQEITYNKIKENILNDITKVKSNFVIINKQTFENAIKEVLRLTNIQIDITSVPNTIKELVKNWNPKWNGEVFKDIYGENVFEKLLKIKSPFDFYTNNTIREYSELVKKFTPPEQKIYTKPRALFNETWYDVEYLDKDWGTGEPLKSYKRELEKNPKSQMYELVNKITVRKGKIPFIKILLRTEQEGKLREVWKEVMPGQVKYQITSFGTKKNRKVR
jgi:hypothetical protein